MILMKQALRKILAAAISVAAINSVVSTAVSAYVWYSDSDIVYRYSSTPNVRVRGVGVDSTNGFTRDYVEGLFENAITEWNKGSYAVASNFITSGTGDIEVYAAKPKTIYDSYGISMIGSNGAVSNGKTLYGTYLKNTTSITVNSSTKTVRTKTNKTPAKIYFANKKKSGSLNIDGNSVSFNARSETGLYNTVKHELGHALGFSGHHTTDSDLMAPGTSNTTVMSVSTSDKRHISQFTNLDTNNVSDFELYTEKYFTNTASDSDKLTTISNSAAFNSNIFVGTPVKILDGSYEELVSDEECSILITDYLFKVNSNKYGDLDEQYIVVRSQVGNCLEIGKEYALSTMHLNNELWDMHILVSKKLFIENTPKNEASLDVELLNNSNESKISTFSSEDVYDNANYTEEFLNDVDIIVDATITELTSNEISQGVYETKLNVNNIIKGNVNYDIFNECIMLKGNLNVGERYIILFNDKGDYIMQASKNGSIIEMDSEEYSTIVNVLAYSNIVEE